MNKERVIAEVIVDLDSIKESIDAANRFAGYLWTDQTEEQRYKTEYEFDKMGGLMTKVQKNLALLKGELP